MYDPLVRVHGLALMYFCIFFLLAASRMCLNSGFIGETQKRKKSFMLKAKRDIDKHNDTPLAYSYRTAVLAKHTDSRDSEDHND